MDTTKKIASPHDRYFKAVMADIVVARDFFERNLSQKTLAHVDLRHLRLCPNSYIEEDLKLSAADVLYETMSSGEATYIYILVEHQSTVDPLMPFRIWKYKMGIWSDYCKSHPNTKKMPYIIPLIFYTGKKKWKASLELKDLMGGPKALVDELYKPPRLLGAGLVRDEILLEQMWTGVLAYFLKQIQYKDLFLKDNVWKVMGHLEGIGSSSFVTTSMHYAIMSGVEIDQGNFWEKSRKYLSCKFGEDVMNLAQQWLAEGEQKGIQKGIQEGIQEGIQKGIQKGQATILLRLLSKKFKTLPEAYIKRIKQADPQALEVWGERVLDAASLEDIFITEHHRIFS